MSPLVSRAYRCLSFLSLRIHLAAPTKRTLAVKYIEMAYSKKTEYKKWRSYTIINIATCIIFHFSRNVIIDVTHWAFNL